MTLHLSSRNILYSVVWKLKNQTNKDNITNSIGNTSQYMSTVNCQQWHKKTMGPNTANYWQVQRARDYHMHHTSWSSRTYIIYYTTWSLSLPVSHRTYTDPGYLTWPHWYLCLVVWRNVLHSMWTSHWWCCAVYQWQYTAYFLHVIILLWTDRSDRAKMPDCNSIYNVYNDLL